MSKRRGKREERRQEAPLPGSVMESGVIPKGLVDEREPPWEVVRAYLERGENRMWVESFAAQSPSFADVLAALRNDHDEREEEERAGGVVVPLKPRS